MGGTRSCPIPGATRSRATILEPFLLAKPSLIGWFARSSVESVLRDISSELPSLMAGRYKDQSCSVENQGGIPPEGHKKDFNRPDRPNRPKSKLSRGRA